MDLNPINILKKGLDVVTWAPRKAIESGVKAADAFLPDTVTLSPKMPGYAALPRGERERAEVRGKGVTYPQKVSNKPGQPDGEPVTLTMAGSLDDVTRALERAGWKKADKGGIVASLKSWGVMLGHAFGLTRIKDFSYDRGPMSTLFIDGKPQVAGFEKNNDHHHTRDHIRVFDSGKRDAQGRPIWEVTASRDLSVIISLPKLGTAHGTDKNLDPERDMLMADLLAAGVVKDWRAVQGTRSAEEDRLIRGTYQTDGTIYQVGL